MIVPRKTSPGLLSSFMGDGSPLTSERHSPPGTSTVVRPYPVSGFLPGGLQRLQAEVTRLVDLVGHGEGAAAGSAARTGLGGAVGGALSGDGAILTLRRRQANWRRVMGLSDQGRRAAWSHHSSEAIRDHQVKRGPLPASLLSHATQGRQAMCVCDVGSLKELVGEQVW